MLAYVFWHQRSTMITREEYQAKLHTFHQILQTRQPQGFVCSLVLEMPHLPWMPAESESYEDWYLVENSAALDPLDEAAVTGICREPHNQVARLADNGTGGLYRLDSATVTFAQLANIHTATWFNKPAGMSYERLYETLKHNQREGNDIRWQRQMTMGPAREFCIHSTEVSTRIEGIESLQVEARPVFIPGR